VAALSFILFGLWTIRGDALKGEDKKESRFGPVLTVAIVFFFAELGDKTQLATISLAVEYQNVFAVLMGTTFAMVIADSIGIVVAIVLGKNLPEKIIKGISAAVFILFGFYGVHNVLSNHVPMTHLIAILGLIIGLTASVTYYLINQTGKLVPAPLNEGNTLAKEDSSPAV
jgi:putative Ca2+/H+ antiporter (TMEM165/GDT1 family)